VHDDRAMVEARLHRVLNEKIRPAMRPSRMPLMVEAWTVPGEPVPVSDALAGSYERFAIGSPWGRPWGTTWFRMVGEVPGSWAGERVEAVVNLGFTNAPGFQCEGLLWHEIAGRWVPWRGLHPFNHDLAVADPAVGGEQVSYLVEAAANPMLVRHRPDPNSDLLTAGDGPVYALSKAELVVVDVEVYELREDVRCLTELMAQLHLDDPRRHEILRSLERMLDVLVLADVSGSAGPARAELAEVLARPATASAHRISAIGHAHLDSAWLWPLRETRRKAARTFSNVLELMKDYPELKFACSQAAQYEWMLEGYPSVFEGISERVAEGRWTPVGGMWVEPDVNLPSGESLVRQFTYGQRFFEQHFGVRCREVWIPDVFGYTAALPQLMRLAGIDRFLTQKLSWNKSNTFPHHTFWWEGIDGSTVFTHFPPIDSYGALFSPTQLSHAVRNFNEKGRSTRSLMPFGFGDGGGGPNRQMMQQYRRVRDLEGMPRIEIESVEEFFDKAMAEYPDAPRWVGELYFETHRGTYTSQAKTKAGNRRCELLLREAELWCVAAFGTTVASGYPKAQLDRIWKTVLLHQFHDILPGSSIAWVHREAEATYAELIDELEAIIAGALSVLAAPRGEGSLVANPAPVARDEIIEVNQAIAPVIPPGAPQQPTSGGRVAVRATVEPLAVAVGQRALQTGPVDSPCELLSVDGVIELGNGLVSCTIDADGLVSSLRAEDGREAVAPGARGNLLQLHPDFPTEYDAWDLDESYRCQAANLIEVDEIEVIDDGPLVVRVRVGRSFRSSRVVQTYELRAGSPRLDIVTEIDWHERDHVLKAAFPLDLSTDELTREIQFGHLTTKIHTNTSWDSARFEVCAHRWVHAGEPDFGVTLLNDSKYGHDATRTRTADDRPSTTVRLTLLKGAQYPDPHADEGHHTFTYSVMAHRGGVAQAVAEGYRLNMPMRAVERPDTPVDNTSRFPGLPVVRNAGGSAVVEAVKPADDDSGDLIVRVYESQGIRSRVELRFARAPESVSVVDLLEEPNDAIPEVPVNLEGDRVLFELHPFQVTSLRVR